MAEAILNKIGAEHFRASSAGVMPTPSTDPTAIELLAHGGYAVEGLKPKHFREFATANADKIDFVFTLSDTAAGEDLPEWPGLPITAHWGSADPILIAGTEWERKQAYSRIMSELERRIAIFTNLPFGSLDRMSLQAKVSEIASA